MVVQRHETDQEANASSKVWIMIYFAANWQDPGSEKIVSESLQESTNVTARLFDFTRSNDNVFVSLLWEKDLQHQPNGVKVKSEDEYPP